jgi:hypothetical protein
MENALLFAVLGALFDEISVQISKNNLFLGY